MWKYELDQTFEYKQQFNSQLPFLNFFFSGTGTPEIGGLTSIQVATIHCHCIFFLQNKKKYNKKYWFDVRIL